MKRAACITLMVHIFAVCHQTVLIREFFIEIPINAAWNVNVNCYHSSNATFKD